MIFRNPQNNYTVETRHPVLFTFLFGPLYFVVHGVWTHAVISLVLAMLTMGFSWILYPFFAPGIIQTAYLKKGWMIDTPPSAAVNTA